MASIKKKSSGGGGANWMDTYGDMVTLLLCFFVLLYSISSLDEAKWMIVVQSFNKDAIVSTDETPRGPEGEDSNQGGDDMPMTQEEVNEQMDVLFEYLKEAAAASSSETTMSVSKGDGLVFIRFDDAVFFAGDKWDLQDEGKAALDTIIPALEIAGPYIDSIEISGHTAQARENSPNTVRGDRTISSNRANEVLIYLQEHSDSRVLDPARMTSRGYGQWRPIAPNDTPEGRAQNRRVELTISGKDIENRLEDSIAKYYFETNQDQPELDATQTGVVPPDTGNSAGTEPGEATDTPEIDQNVLDLLGPDGGAASAVQPSGEDDE